MGLKGAVFEDLHSIHLAQDGQIAGSCKQCSEPSVSIKCEDFVDWLSVGNC
jgi:hypothetical protein